MCMHTFIRPPHIYLCMFTYLYIYMIRETRNGKHFTDAMKKAIMRTFKKTTTRVIIYLILSLLNPQMYLIHLCV